jgi:hypothetical protein
MKAVILVPRRNDDGPRDALWAWCKAWWRANLPELPIFEGEHTEGLFNRSAAVNTAAKKAGKWDVAVIIDADVICDPGRVREAVKLTAGEMKDRLVLPFDRRHNLSPSGSMRIRNGDQGSWKGYIAKTYTEMCSSCVMVSRSLWDTVGGFDEEFAGWGFEDTAFSLACETFGEPMHKIEGELWHLWHPTAPEGRKGTPSYQRNRHRRELYQAALGDREATRALIDGKPWRPSVVRREERIPRILHRTVPEHTTAEVEGWWEAFGALHPDWELLTHRDPLDPKEWPLTGHLFATCETGAQLADLVRLEALYRFGGIYIDSDCEPYRSLEPLLPLHAFAAWEDRNVIPNAVMGAEPEHPAIRMCIDLAIKRHAQGTWKAGTGVTTEVLQNRDDVLLLPPGAFFPVHYRDPQRVRKMAKHDPDPWTFLLHRYHGSWLAKTA